MHRMKYFYSENLLLQPEYRFENKNSVFKRKDKEFMLEYLEMKEKEENEKRAAEEAELAAQTAAAAGGKKDAKKADKKAPAKGATPVEDKNNPQPITIEYPDAIADDDFLVYERNFLTPTVTIQMAKQAGAPKSAALITGKTNKNAWGNLANSLKDRTKELVTQYKIVRGSAYSLAVKVKLNKEEEVEFVPEETVEEPVAEDPKKKGKK